jgi:hypothetical protein
VTTTDPPTPPSAQKSPSYPQRVHLKEKPQWQALLKTWEDRIAAVVRDRTAVDDGADRDSRGRLYAQMLGARDQLADAVRRLPMEVGFLYDEDRLRAEEAVAALERLFKQSEGKA